MENTKCPVAKKCSGCQLSNLSYEQQLAWKQKDVAGLLGSYGEVSPIIPMEPPCGYRCKVQAVFRSDRSGRIISGVYQSSRNGIVGIDRCMVNDPRADEIIVGIRELMRSFKIRPWDPGTDRGFIKHVLVRIGRNTKVALDITAKHVPDHIGWLDEKEFREKLWSHRPITDFWNVGSGVARRLAKYGVYDMGGVAKMNEDILYKEFGVNAEFLIDHAHGREPCTMAEIHAYESKTKSLSNGQILFEDYSADNAFIVMKEMADTLILELVEKKLAAGSVSLTVGYSKDVFPPTGGTRKLSGFTGSRRKLTEEFIRLYNDTTRRKYPIRSINIGLGGLVEDVYSTFDLFMDPAAEEKEKNMQNAIIDIKRRFGKNSLIKAMSLQEKATGIRRNNMVGGHNGG